MRTLYVITGPAGVGKSTISNGIANKLKKSALIEGDEIYSQVISSYISAWKKGNHLDLFYKNCFDLINNYLDNGYDVVFNYIITPKILNEIKLKFKNIKIKFIVLLTDEKIILERDSLRPIDCRMNERCIILLNEFKDFKFNDKYIFDTTNVSINETVFETINNDRFIVND